MLTNRYFWRRKEYLEMKKLLFSLSLIVVTLCANAIPAKRGMWKNIQLADGTTVKAMLKGDEFLHYYATEAGVCYVPSASEEGVYVEADMADLRSRAENRRAAMSPKSRARLSLSPRQSTRANTGGATYSYKGVEKGLIILVQFSDKAFQAGHDQAKYNDVANKEDYVTSEGFVGSVRDYFEAQSNGVFYIDFDVVGPVTLTHSYSYYGANNRNGEDMRAGQMVAEACLAVDSLVDFAKYDWDNDGEVDQIYVLYAGYGEASCDDAKTVWPHMWDLASSDYRKALNLDGVIVNTYACSNEMEYYSDGGTGIAGIGSFCHEFSHCLGLPDLYDTGGSDNFGMSYWDLMDSGCYNGDTFRPAGYTSYEKMVAGWLNPIELTESTDVTGQQALSENGDAYIIYNDANANEFYLLENRQPTGWDKELYGNGLLVLHVDYDEKAWTENTVNNVSSRQRCTIIPADNSATVTARSLAGDPYPYNGNDSLTNFSQPRASLYNANADGSKLMNKGIYNIKRNSDGTMSFSFKGNSATGIADVKAAKTATGTSRIYTLSGQYVGVDLERLGKGVYVVDGRKVVK